MASYLVLKPQGGRVDPDSVRFVRDGFSWFALFFPLVWMLFHRMWLYALMLFVVQLGIGLAGEALGVPGATGVVLVGLNLLVALESGAIRERFLRSAGWSVAAVVSADTIDDAEALYFSQEAVAGVPPAAFPTAVQPPRHARGGTALGLFESYKGV